MNNQRKGSKMDRKLFFVLGAILIAFTFLSKPFYNYRLPTVSAARPIQGKLMFSVDGSTVFTYACVNPVYAQTDGRVKEILVEKGDEVTAGQCVMRFESGAEGELIDVTAAEDGIITGIGVKDGMYVSSMQNTILYELAKKSDELLCSLLLNEEQAGLISMQSKVSLDFRNRNEPAEGAIQSIVSYTGQSGEGYRVDITVKMEDNSLIGERVNVTIKEESALYDTLVPAAALCKDASGYYVLALHEDDSLLGRGYQAHRISVDLLDSDDSYCAVRGLPMDERVIFAATSEIAPGSDVYYEGEVVQ